MKETLVLIMLKPFSLTNEETENFRSQITLVQSDEMVAGNMSLKPQPPGPVALLESSKIWLVAYMLAEEHSA